MKNFLSLCVLFFVCNLSYAFNIQSSTYDVLCKDAVEGMNELKVKKYSIIKDRLVNTSSMSEARILTVVDKDKLVESTLILKEGKLCILYFEEVKFIPVKGK